MRKGNRLLIKELNRNLVLNLIKTHGPISRTQLARQSGLSPATISSITADLIDSGFVHEMGQGESSGGRRPVLLRLNQRAGFVVGVKLMEDAITSALTDLDAQVLHHRLTRFDLREAPTVERVLALIIEAIEKTIDESGTEQERVLGIGVGMAGTVDGRAGVARYSPFFHWQDVQIAQPISSHFDLPVYVENDVNTLTIAEKWFGYGRNAKHFVVVTVGRGIGAGIIMNDQFYGGAFGGAGEFGHIPLADGENVKTLETLASDPAVLAAARVAIAQGKETSLGTADPLDIEAIVVAAEEGDDLARQLLADSGRWLGIGISTLVNILNPELVIVAGEGVRAGRWRLQPMRAAVDEHVFASLGGELEIVVEPSGDETWARGAACVVLGELFKSPVHREVEGKVMRVSS